MKHTRLIAIAAALLLLLAGTLSVSAAESESGYDLPDGVTVYADAALLVNLGSTAATDVEIYARGADDVHAPASMIRYMVVAYALTRVQELGMDVDTATGTYTLDMFNQYVAGTGVPTANMAYGETWTLRDLIAVSFLQSASDAVTTLAFAIDGSVETYVQGMNDLAAKLGCDYTHYANVTGLDSLSQYTTPRDMYRIIRYAMGLSQFEDIVSARQITVTPVSGGTARTMVSVNHQQQSSSTFYYSPLVFGRTGLSSHEGRTYAAVARDSGYEYLAVVMGAPEQTPAGETGVHYRDARTLFRWGFNYFEYSNVLAASEILASVPVRLSWSTDHINLVPAHSFSTVVEQSLDPDQIIKRVTVFEESVDAPIEAGQVLGRVELIVNVDQKIGEVDLVASQGLSRNWLLFALSGIGSFFASGWFFAGVGVLLLLIIGYVILNISYNRRRRRERLGRVRTPRG